MKNKNKTVYLSSLHKDPLLYQLQPPLTSATAAASPVLLCVDHSVPPPFLLLHLVCLSITHSLIVVALEAEVCHIIYSLVQIALLADVHCISFLVWSKVSGFYYTINTGLLLRLLSDIPLLP